MKKTILMLIMMAAVAMSSFAQHGSVRVSGTQLLTGTFNMEINMGVSKKMTVHLPLSYNPFVYGDNTRLQQLSFMPGVRYWFDVPYAHHFVSAYGVASRFHFGGMFGMKDRYDGKAFGLGVGYGYSWMLSKRLNLECEFGIAALKADYDKCRWYENSYRESTFSGIKIFPTKLDVSVAYIF